MDWSHVTKAWAAQQNHCSCRSISSESEIRNELTGLHRHVVCVVLNILKHSSLFSFGRIPFRFLGKDTQMLSYLQLKIFFYLQILYFVSKRFSIETYFKIIESWWKTKWNLHMYVIIVLQILFLLVTEIY